MMKQLSFSAFIVIMCLGCTPNIMDQIKDLSGRKISFDFPLTWALRDSMSTGYRIRPDSGVKFIVLYDSTECSSCRVNMLNRYDDIFSLSKNEGANFVPIIIFSPAVKQIRDLKYDLKSSDFSYPIYIDSCHNFCKINSYIPSDSRLHAFLLNQNDEIVLVGNPINNPTLWKLYENTIRSLNNDGTKQ